MDIRHLAINLFAVALTLSSCKPRTDNELATDDSKTKKAVSPAVGQNIPRYQKLTSPPRPQCDADSKQCSGEGGQCRVDANGKIVCQKSGASYSNQVRTLKEIFKNDANSGAPIVRSDGKVYAISFGVKQLVRPITRQLGELWFWGKKQATVLQGVRTKITAAATSNETVIETLSEKNIKFMTDQAITLINKIDRNSSARFKSVHSERIATFAFALAIATANLREQIKGVPQKTIRTWSFAIIKDLRACLFGILPKKSRYEEESANVQDKKSYVVTVDTMTHFEQCVEKFSLSAPARVGEVIVDHRLSLVDEAEADKTAAKNSYLRCIDKSYLPLAQQKAFDDLTPTVKQCAVGALTIIEAKSAVKNLFNIFK